MVFTTPYIFIATRLRDWHDYFSRVLPEAPPQARLAACEHHMKYGPSRSYWNEFVFEGYVNYTSEAVFITGLPDIAESWPHSRVSQERDEA